MPYAMPALHAALRRFLRDGSGSILAITALVLPIIAGTGLFAIDHIFVSQKVSSLQRAADISAIAAARELHFIAIARNGNGETLKAIAEGYARQNLPDEDITTTAVVEGETIVTVEVSQVITSPLGMVFKGGKTLRAQATAEVFGGQNICIIATDRGKKYPGISTEDDARIDADGCGIYSNSKQTFSIRARESSRIDAAFICAAGGYDGGEGNTGTPVTTECPQIKDPLNTRTYPPVRGCNSDNPGRVDRNRTVSLKPGTYCGGIEITGNAQVDFAPGVYIFQDGPLLIGGNSTVTGENVGLFFADNKSYFEFNESADIVLTAPETGPMAGIVAWAKRLCNSRTARCEGKRYFKINSANVRSLLGTIYMPVDDLIIDTTMPVSDEAAFTIIIVDNLTLKRSPVLVLNTDYAATKVPVPAGFVGQPGLRLIR